MDTKRTVICAVLGTLLGSRDVVLSIETKRVSTVSPGLAFADGGSNPSYTSRENKLLQLAAIAFGECGHDHLVCGARASDKALGVKARIGRRRWRRARLRRWRPLRPCPSSAPPRLAGSAGRLTAGSAGRCGKATILSLAGAAHRVARGIGIVGRPLPPGPLSKTLRSRKKINTANARKMMV